MLRKVNLFTTIKTAAIAAVLFSLPILLFIWDATYTETWLLFIGCFLFFIVIFIHTLSENKRRGENESTVALVFISHVATFVGVLFACLISFILLVLMVPGYLGEGDTDKLLKDIPTNTVTDKTGGLSFKVFMAASFGNFTVGSFAGIILPFYSKRNQTKDTRDPAPLHQRGAQ